MRRTLILGGTAWLGGEVARQAVARGDEVVCLARGEAGRVPDGVRLVRADRSSPDAYAPVADADWDLVVDVSRQPGHVRSAVEALAGRARHWVYVSSCSVYADHSELGTDESAELLPALDTDVADVESYGEGKVACEEICVAALGERVTLARSGLIGGWGDGSDRFGYWPGRFALAGDEPVLVPDADDMASQIIHVADLAAWLLLAGEERLGGAYNVLGPAERLGDTLACARDVGGHTGDVVRVPGDWLEEQGVAPFMGERSVPLWIPDPDWAGFSARSAARAVAAGLVCRSTEDTMRGALAYEQELGLARTQRRAGLTRAQELDLLGVWQAPR
ncbi:MAG: NAD-dependent epimerase/dehydratase family protein [Actinomycetia bacterium]|nr:NAD-dependent epimerase/dehydratase family protein [Actinomycetes bacterium]